MSCQKASVSAAGSDFYKLAALCIPGFIKDHPAASSLLQLKDSINLWLVSQGLSSGALISAKRSEAVAGQLVHTHAVALYPLSEPRGRPSPGCEDGIDAW